MRVCVINEFFYPDSTGGTGTVLSELAQNLMRCHDDIEITVITSTNLYRKSVETLQKFEEWDGIEIHRIASPHPNSLPILGRLLINISYTIKTLLKLLQLGRFDVVITGTAPPMSAFAASAYKLLTRTPFIYIVYDLEPDRAVAMRIVGKNNPFVKLFKRLQHSWLKASNRVVVLGRCMRDSVIEEYKLPSRKIDVIPIGASDTDIVPGERQSRFRNENAITGFVVLYSGNFARYHNFDTILDAAKSINLQKLAVTFILVGDGVQKEHIDRRISGEHIDNVRVFDFVDADSYGDLLATADVSLVTLEPNMEGLCVPSKFYSILASGRPVIGMVAPRSEVALVINEARCGVQIEQGDTQKLVDTLLWFLEHPKERSEMGKAARSALVNRFSTNMIAEQYYETILLASGSRNKRVVPQSRLNGDAARYLYAPKIVDEENSPQVETVPIELSKN